MCHDRSESEPVLTVRSRRLTTALALIGFVVGVPVLHTFAADPPWIARGTQGLVATDSKHASQAGLEMLRSGGNAVDAAVAASFALAVTRPYSTGLGGGGFMIVRFADGRIACQDFRETAPAAATADMFVNRVKNDPGGLPPSEYGHLAVAVPGLVAGRCQALTQFGTMSLKEVLAPAIRLAESGYPVDDDYVGTIRSVLETYRGTPSLKESCGYVWRTHLGDGRVRQVGDRLVQPELAKLLRSIASEGPDFFYRGPVAQAIAREMERHGGIITKKDLADYETRTREPLVATYRDYLLITMPPPSSGGVAIAETLNILEALDHAAIVGRDPALALHYRIEAMKHAFADRARWLGDQDFVSVPVERLISKSFAAALARTIGPEQTSDVQRYGYTGVPKDAGTSHLCVVDRHGNVVVSTETINTSFGSLAAVDEWGLILNNEMDDFTAEPGKPNAYGLRQSAANSIAPGKRPLSSMSPTIVLKGQEPYLLLGGSGGPRIISSVLNVMLGVTDSGLSLEQAMLRRRPHHQWRPDLVYFDDEPSPDVVADLVGRGHKISERRRTGVIQAILRTKAPPAAKQGWVGASDPRKGGIPAGY